MTGIFKFNLHFSLLIIIFHLRLSNIVPREYNFAPKTWVLPNDYNLWYSYASNKPKKDPSAYIVKPSNAAMSQG
jgi:hypothetical protein